MAACSPYFAAAAGIRSAIVRDPEPMTALDAVAVASIRALLLVLAAWTGQMLDVSRARRPSCGARADARSRAVAPARVPPPRLHGIGHVEEHVAHAEALRDELAEAAHAEGLRRVVARRDEVHARLSRFGHHPLGGLAGDEGVGARRDRFAQVLRARAGDHGE